MKPRPFVLLGDSALRAVDARCMRAVAQWSADWGCALDEQAIACGACTAELAARDPQWRSWRCSGEAAAWIGTHGDCEDAVAGLIAGGETLLAAPMRVTPLAARAAGEAFADLVAALVQAVRGKPGAPQPFEPDVLPPAVLARGSGAIAVALSLGAARLTLVVPHDQVAWPDPARRTELPAHAVVPALAAAQGAPVTVRAEMGTVEVAVGAVQELAPGDVIRLGRHLSDPFDLVAADGTPLCRGHLGAFEGRRALDLVP